MRKAFKQIFAGFIYSIMTLSFILSPIPKVNVAYAEEAQNCYNAEEDGTGNNQVYRQGCDFDEVMNKTDLKDTGSVHADGSGVGTAKQIFQQYIVAVFGVVLLNSLDFRYTRRSVTDCPMNRVADTSLRVAQLSSLSYILGDVIANMKFKDAAKEANDRAFSFTARPGAPTEEEIEQALANGEQDPRLAAARQENEQIQAFDTLISVYEKQLSGIKTKLALATIAELGFLATEGVELVGMARCKAKCAETRNAAVIDDKEKKVSLEKALAELQAFVTMAKAEMQANQASCIACETAAKAATPVSTSAIVACHTSVGSSTPPNFNCLNLGSDGLEMANKCEVRVHSAIARIQAQIEATQGTLRELASRDKAQTEGFFRGLQQRFMSLMAKIHEKFDSDPPENTRESELTQEAREGYAAKNMQEQIMEGLKGHLKSFEQTLKGCSRMKFSAPGNYTRYHANLAAKVGGVLNAMDDRLAALQPVELKSKPIYCCGSDLMNREDEFIDDEGRQEWIQDLVAAVLNSDDPTQTAQQRAREIQASFSEADIANSGGAFTSYPTLGTTAISFPSIYHKKSDIFIQNLFGGEDNAPGWQGSPATGPASSSSNLQDVDKHIEDMTYNILMKLALNEIKLKKNKPVENLGKIRKISETINGFMQAQKIYLSENKEHVERSQKKLVKLMNEGQIQDEKSFFRELSNFLINEVHAVDYLQSLGGVAIQRAPDLLGIEGKWVELFNFGGKLMQLNGILKSFARNTALISPSSRSWTWIALITAAGATILFDAQAAKTTQERIDMVKAEKDRYLKSVRGGSNIDGDTPSETRDGSGLLAHNDARGRYGIRGTSNVRACAVPNGNGFAPSDCSGNIPRSGFNIDPMDPRIQNGLDPSHVQGMGMMSNLVADAATGNIGDEGLGDARLGQVRSVSSAIRKANDKLRKQLDKEDGKGKKKSEQTGSLQAMQANMKKFLGDPNGASSADLASLTAPTSAPGKNQGKESETEESGMTKTSAFEDYSGGAAKTASVPEFSFGDYGEGGIDSQAEQAAAFKPEENLEDFVLNHDDINKKKDVSIFKILSNRYLLSYPKVLDEEKPQQ